MTTVSTKSGRIIKVVFNRRSRQGQHESDD